MFKGFYKDRGHQLSGFWGLTGKSHLGTAIILTLFSKGFAEYTNRIGNYRKKLWGFFSPPLHCVSVPVSGSLINLCCDFLFPECIKCSLWSCQISPNFLLLSDSPFVFYLSLIYTQPCVGDGICVYFNATPAWGSCISRGICDTSDP